MITSSCRQLQLIPSVVFAVGRRELRVPRQKRPHTLPATILSCQDCRRQRPLPRPPSRQNQDPATMRPGEPMRRREQQCSSDDGPCAGQSNKRRSDCDRRPSENGGRCCQVRRSLQDQQSPALVARHRSHPRQNCKRAVRSNIGSEHQDQRSDCWRRKAQNGDDEQNRGSTAQPDSPPVTRQTSAHPSRSRIPGLHLESISGQQ